MILRKFLLIPAVLFLVLTSFLFSKSKPVSRAQQLGDLTVGSGETKVHPKGRYPYRNVTIKENGTLTHESFPGNNRDSTLCQLNEKLCFNQLGLVLEVTGTLTIEKNGKIDVSGKGYTVYGDGAGTVGDENYQGQNGAIGGTEQIQTGYDRGGTGGGSGGDPFASGRGMGPGGGGGHIGGGGNGYGFRFGGGGSGESGGPGSGGYGANLVGPTTSGGISYLMMIIIGAQEVNFNTASNLADYTGFGGAGGSGWKGILGEFITGRSPNGSGGGRIVIKAKKVALNENSQIRADGSSAPALSNLWPNGNQVASGGGGGAGGTVAIITEELSTPSLSPTNPFYRQKTPKISAQGGQGASGNYSFRYDGWVNFGEGGAGGGGLVITAVKNPVSDVDALWNNLIVLTDGGPKTRDSVAPNQAVPDSNAGNQGFWFKIAEEFPRTITVTGDIYSKGNLNFNLDSSSKGILSSGSDIPISMWQQFVWRIGNYLVSSPSDWAGATVQIKQTVARLEKYAVINLNSIDDAIADMGKPDNLANAPPEGRIYYIKKAKNNPVHRSFIVKGKGTIILEPEAGVYNLNADIIYSQDLNDHPSLGLIVLNGSINVDSSVSSLMGAYFATGDIYFPASNNFYFKGLLAGSKINLPRSGQFKYDPYLVTNPPPGFRELFKMIYKEASP